MRNYKIVGEGTNIQLVRLDDKGKSTSARPASPEELELYKTVLALEAEREEQTHRIVQLRARVSGALAYAPELADITHSERAQWLTQRLAEDVSMMEAKESADLGTLDV